MVFGAIQWFEHHGWGNTKKVVLTRCVVFGLGVHHHGQGRKCEEGGLLTRKVWSLGQGSSSQTGKRGEVGGLNQREVVFGAGVHHRR